MNNSIERAVGLDVLRILSAFMVCMFHTTIHLGCNYGILQGMSRSGAVFMTAFFMLSGFALFINYSGKDFSDFSQKKYFWKKRILKIYPMYIIVSSVYVFLHLLFGASLYKSIIAIPVEILGIQSVFSSLFSFSHNGGTWFISCILICYLFYPFVQGIINSLKKVKFGYCLFALLFYCMPQ